MTLFDSSLISFDSPTTTFDGASPPSLSSTLSSTSFTITPIAYDSLQVVWTFPTGSWNEMVLLRSAFGTPQSIYAGDGQTLIDQTNGLTTLETALIENTVYTSITVAEIPNDLAYGDNLTLVDLNNGTTQVVTIGPNGEEAGATVLQVLQFTALDNFTAGTVVWATSFTDTELPSGHFYYYTLLVFSEVLGEYVTAGAAQGLVITNFNSGALYAGWLPDWYSTQDQTLTTLSQPLGPLERFLNLIGYEMDWLRSEIESFFLFSNVNLVSGALLQALGANYGMGYEPELGMSRSRVLVKNAVYLYKNRGTNTGIGSAASAFSGYGVNNVKGITLSPNIEIQLDDSAFDRSVGHWVSGNSSSTIEAVAASLISTSLVPPHTLYNPVPQLTSMQAGNPEGYLPTNNKNVAVISGNAATPQIVWLTTCTSENATSLGIPVTPGVTYVLSVYFQPEQQTTPTLRAFFMQMDWYTQTGVFISSHQGTPVTEVSDEWVRAYVAFTAPSGSAYMGRTVQSTTTISGDRHLFDAEQIEVNTQATPGPSSWQPPRDIQVNLLPVRQNLITNPVGLATPNPIAGWSIIGGVIESSSSLATPPLITWPAETTSGFVLVSEVSYQSADGPDIPGASFVGGAYPGGAAFSASGTTIVNMVLSRVIPVTGGSVYSLSLYMQAATVGRPIQVAITYSDINGNTVGSIVFSGSLSQALLRGQAYTTVEVNSLPFAVVEGQVFTINDSGSYQNVAVSAAAPAGSMTLSVENFVANFSYPENTELDFGSGEFFDEVGGFTRGSLIDNVAPIGAVNALIKVTVIGPQPGEVHYLGAPLFEPESALLPYFDATSTLPSSDYLWEGTPNDSISDYYPDYPAKLSRLIMVLPDYTPIGSTFSLFLGAQAFIQSGLAGQ